MKASKVQVFLSYSSDDAFEASLLQYALENMLADLRVTVWTYQRDQSKSQRGIARSLKDYVRQSRATIFLLSPSTLNSGATQWMELAYSDAFNVPTFVLLHRVSFAELKTREKGVPPLLVERQCNAADEWKTIATELRKYLSTRKVSGT